MTEIPLYPSTIETRYDCPDDVKEGVVERAKEQAEKEGLKMITVDGMWATPFASRSEATLPRRSWKNLSAR